MSAPDLTAGPRGASIAETFLRSFQKLAAVQPGERVLDIWPGAGEALLEAARRSGDTGEVLAVSDSEDVLALAAARAREAGRTNLRTAAGDPANLQSPDAYWDVVLCHFGVAELPDLEAALKEARRVLRPVGRIAVSTLGERGRCPMVTLFADALAPHVPAVESELRRLFRYGEPGKLAALLADLGYEDASPERLTEWVPFADVDDYWQTMVATSPLGRLARALSPEAVAAAKADLTRKSRFYRRGDGLEMKIEAIVLGVVK